MIHEIRAESDNVCNMPGRIRAMADDQLAIYASCSAPALCVVFMRTQLLGKLFRSSTNGQRSSSSNQNGYRGNFEGGATIHARETVGTRWLSGATRCLRTPPSSRERKCRAARAEVLYRRGCGYSLTRIAPHRARGVPRGRKGVFGVPRTLYDRIRAHGASGIVRLCTAGGPFDPLGHRRRKHRPPTRA